MLRKTIAIDLDGVIHDYKKVEWPLFGLPMEDAQPSLKKLQRLNNKIVIFTSRASTRQALSEIIEWLNLHKIPFDEVTNMKGDFDYIIDDRAIHFDNWAEIMKAIKL